jgi:hypothetical protein
VNDGDAALGAAEQTSQAAVDFQVARLKAVQTQEVAARKFALLKMPGARSMTCEDAQSVHAAHFHTSPVPAARIIQVDTQNNCDFLGYYHDDAAFYCAQYAAQWYPYFWAGNTGECWGCYGRRGPYNSGNSVSSQDD